VTAFLPFADPILVNAVRDVSELSATTIAFRIFLLVLVVIIFVFALLALIFRVILPMQIFRSSAQERKRDLEQLLATGSPLAHMRCGGALGRQPFQGPTINVTVYPGGIAIKPIFMPTAVIFNRDITGIRPWSLIITEGIYLDHRGRSIVTPVSLECQQRHPLRELLTARVHASGVQ
jgi:hypothetical protein